MALTKENKENILRTVRRNEQQEISEHLRDKVFTSKKVYNRKVKHKHSENSSRA